MPTIDEQRRVSIEASSQRAYAALREHIRAQLEALKIPPAAILKSDELKAYVLARAFRAIVVQRGHKVRKLLTPRRQYNEFRDVAYLSFYAAERVAKPVGKADEAAYSALEKWFDETGQWFPDAPSADKFATADSMRTTRERREKQQGKINDNRSPHLKAYIQYLEHIIIPPFRNKADALIPDWYFKFTVHLRIVEEIARFL